MAHASQLRLSQGELEAGVKSKIVSREEQLGSRHDLFHRPCLLKQLSASAVLQTPASQHWCAVQRSGFNCIRCACGIVVQHLQGYDVGVVQTSPDESATRPSSSLSSCSLKLPEGEEASSFCRAGFPAGGVHS